MLRNSFPIASDVPKGYRQIRVNFQVKTDGDANELKELAQMSPVFNSIRGSVPVVVKIETY